jgi:hypothetical protein
MFQEALVPLNMFVSVKEHKERIKNSVIAGDSKMILFARIQDLE